MSRKFSVAMAANNANRTADGGDLRKLKFPKVRDLSDLSKVAKILPSLPSREVLDKLGQHALVVGVDIETADWTHRKNSLRKGQFGFHTMCDADVFDQRIVQLGWFIKDLTNNASAEERGEMIVQPDGFEISAKATKLHGVSTQRAQAEGLPLKSVLDSFMRVLEHAYQRGGRVVIHHLEFDAGIIDKELETAGLHHWRPQWHAMAQAGFCTMDPVIGKWIQTCCGREFDVHENSLAVMSLEKTIHLLSPILPASEALSSFRANRLHTAEADAQLHCVVYIALREMSTNALA